MSVASVSPYDQHYLLVPQDVKKTFYDGYIIVKDQEFRLQVILSRPEDVKGARFRCGWALKNLIAGHETSLEQKLERCSSIKEFLEELRVLVETILNVRAISCLKPLSNSVAFSRIVQDLQLLGWNKVLYANEDFNLIKLVASDVAGRRHVMTLLLNDQFPVAAPKCAVDLPKAFEPKWSGQSASLAFLYDSFCKNLDLFQSFWSVMDELDAKCWILEPEHKTRGCTSRRIALGGNSSLCVSVDPVRPTSFPECRFLGADHMVEPLRRRLNSSLSHWDDRVSVLQNLKDILQVELPGADACKKADDVSMNCGICYSFRLDDEIPERTCDDPRCAQAFHTSCLVEWLRSTPSYRQSFNVIFGECPYCSKSMTVKMAKPCRR